MAINLTKTVTDLGKRRGSSQSWSDFYINMIVDMEEIALVDLAAKGAKTAALKFGSAADNVYVNKAADIANLSLFAKSLMDEYDGLMKSGKTIIGGVPVSSPNKKIATALLIAILIQTNYSSTGNLLRDIGPVFQAYWAGAELSKFPVPNIPCIGSIKNLNTINAINLSPGVWIPVVVPPIPFTSQFLLSFILSAQLHLLTLGGFFTCMCQYPPPSPPAVGALPYFGYVVDGFSNPINTFKGVTALEVGAVVVAKGVDVATDVAKNTKINDAITSVISDTTVDSKIKDALKAIQSQDKQAMAAAGKNLSGTASKQG